MGPMTGGMFLAYVGTLPETAANLRKVFEFASKQPCVLFLYEFDALARAEYGTYADNHYLVVRCEGGWLQALRL
jgi:AAA+ superfamily predicted ATPase